AHRDRGCLPDGEASRARRRTARGHLGCRRSRRKPESRRESQERTVCRDRQYPVRLGRQVSERALLGRRVNQSSVSSRQAFDIADISTGSDNRTSPQRHRVAEKKQGAPPDFTVCSSLTSVVKALWCFLCVSVTPW